MPIRVIYGEDSALLREGVSKMLSAAPDIDLLAACSNFDELMRLAASKQPDVVITDIRMPPTCTDEGIRVAVALRASHPDMGVIVLSQHADPVFAQTLLENGSTRRAYLLKDRVADPDSLLATVRTIASGGSVFDPIVVEALVAIRTRKASSPLNQLTPREIDILSEMAQGRSNAAIAGRLTLTERAVEKHSNSIFSKLLLTEEPDVNRRVKAVLLYLTEAV